MYETFFEDAKTIARELEITLTARGKGDTKAPLAGIPYHAIEPYIAKLIKKGYKVGIVEQTEDPKKAKGLVKRDLVRIVTPGTVVDSLILEDNSNNYIVSIKREDNTVSLSFCDISTGEFKCTTLKKEKLFGELERLNPAEIICEESIHESAFMQEIREKGYIVNPFSDRFFYFEKAHQSLKEHFDVINLEGFGLHPQHTEEIDKLIGQLESATGKLETLSEYFGKEYGHDIPVSESDEKEILKG